MIEELILAFYLLQLIPPFIVCNTLFVWHFRSVFQVQGNLKISMFSSRGFIVFVLTSRSMIHFDLISVYGMK